MSTTFTVSSTEDLNDALSRATGGDRIELAAGEYSLDLSAKSGFDVTYDARVTITSADPGNIATFTQMKLNGVSNLTLDTVVFDYTFSEGDPNWYRPFEVNGSNNVRISNSLFEGDVASGVSEEVDGYGYAYGLSVRESTDVEISGNEFTTWTRALIVSESQNVSISDNDIHSIRSDGINLSAVQSVWIEDNFIHDFVIAPETSDHRDMIQMWTNGTTIQSRDIVVRGNILDVGDGGATQSIFMRNELVDTGQAGKDMFYQNILIEENIIYNAHSAGINIGETNGLVIRKNSVLSVKEADLIPAIKVAIDAKDVVIEQNATARIDGYEGQVDWTLARNAFVQNNDHNLPGYYEVEFLTSSIEGKADDFIIDPEGVIAGLGAGASRLQLETTPEALVPAFDVKSDPDDPAVLVFDAIHSYGPSGQVREADGTFEWDFGDGTVATGLRVAHEFEVPGSHPVTLTLTLSDGTSVSAQGTIAVPGPDILSFNAETGTFEVQGYGETVALEGTEAASVTFNGQQALDLGGSGTSLSIPRDHLDRFFGTEDFTLSMTIMADEQGTSGELFRLMNSFVLWIGEEGDITLRIWTDSEDIYLVTSPDAVLGTSSSGVRLNDGEVHDIAIAFDGATDTVQIVVDGRVEATAQIEGAMPTMGSWDLAFGNAWGKANFDGKLLAFDLDAAARLYPEFNGDVAEVTDATYETSPEEPESAPAPSSDDGATETETETNDTDTTDDTVPDTTEDDDAGSLLPELEGWELDFAALESSKSSLRGDAFVTSDEAGASAVVFDGQGDYARLGRLVEFENAEALTASITFQRTNPDGDYERIVWNHEKFGIGVYGEALFVHVASPDRGFSDPVRIHDLGLSDTEEHNVRVAIDEVTDRLQVILDGQLVFDDRATDIEISGVGAPQWFVGTKIDPGFEGSVSELQLQAESLFVEDGLFIA